MRSKYINISLLFFALIAPLQSNEGSSKIFNQKSAIINYQIKGHGKISTGNRLEIEGNATLIFDRWGSRKIYKEKYIERTIGSLESTNIVRRFKKEENGVISSVDFKNKKIDISENLIARDAIENGKNLHRISLQKMEDKGSNIGLSSILGYQCDEWLYKGKKSCLYHGIPLKEEFVVSSIPLVKIATLIEFDRNISQDTFALPDFKEQTQKGFLMEEGKRRHIQNIQKVKKVIEDEVSNTIEVNIDDIVLESDDKYRDDIYEKQKEFIPKILYELEESRVCLERAEETHEANLCLEKLNNLQEKMSGNRENNIQVADWNMGDRSIFLNTIELNILELKRRAPCVRKSKNIDDLSICLEDTVDSRE